MHLGLEKLLEFYRCHRSDDSLVLGTVVATEGSTYRKPGAMMLVAGDGSYQGLISGGCLEADLAMQASQVFSDGESREICYDMSAGDELVWSLGLGCDGVIHLLLQRLDRHDRFGFFEMLAHAQGARRDGMIGLVTHSTDPAYTPGDAFLDCGRKFRCGVLELTESVRHLAHPHDHVRRYWLQDVNTDNGRLKLLLVPITTPPALLICGAGVDAVPVARLSAEMGWECSIVDHRPGYARHERFPPACRVHLLQPEQLGSSIDLQRTDAVIIMSHNLGHDRRYLSQVIKAAIPYIGLLGPRARRDRLLDELGKTNGTDNIHVHGPAGLDIGAELPESIALAIIAEIHAYLNHRAGGALTPLGT